MILLNPTKKTYETIFNSLTKEFNSFFKAKVNSSLEFDFSLTFDVIQIHSHSVSTDGALITILTSDSDVTISKNYKGAYNVDLIMDTLKEFFEEKLDIAPEKNQGI